MADSLPEPIPLTKTEIFSTFNFLAVKQMLSATLEAAKGVAFFVPLKPIDPALAQVKTLPLRSVKVIIVLL